MTQTCWFCKKNPEDPTKTIEVPLYKIIQTEQEYLWKRHEQKASGIKTTYQYHPTKVLIPRCNKCAKANAKAHAVSYVCGTMGLIALLITIVLIIVASPVNVKIVFSVICGLWTAVLLYTSVKAPKYYLRGILAEGYKDTHPEVISLMRAGYHIGKSPTDPHRSG